MKLQNIVLIPALILATAGYSFAQTNIFPTKPWNATIKVVGEDRLPISGANVVVGYFLPPYAFSDDPKYSDRITGMTDTNGTFFATHNDRTAEIGFSVNKEEYYETRSVRTLRDPGDSADDRDISITLTLKKVGKPTAMYAKRIRKNPPILNQPVGYDLMVGDWVGPYGKGVNTDMIFQADDYRKSGTDYKHNITISFPKKGDGIQICTIPDSEKGSGLRSPHEAPLDSYQPELNKERSAHPGQPARNDDDPNQIYLFRVRTRIDDGGNIVSAHYGKIYGDFMQFTYYLNPTPNDRNIEFDPKQNLLSGEPKVTVP
jgi:hypothetical protein